MYRRKIEPKKKIEAAEACQREEVSAREILADWFCYFDCLLDRERFKTLSFSCFYFNNCYVFVQQCGQFISRKSFNVAQPRIAPRIGVEEYDKLIAGI